jgi:hypothetical protein
VSTTEDAALVVTVTAVVADRGAEAAVEARCCGLLSGALVGTGVVEPAELAGTADPGVVVPAQPLIGTTSSRAEARTGSPIRRICGYYRCPAEQIPLCRVVCH